MPEIPGIGKWALPSGPSDPVYRDILQDIESEPNLRARRAKFRALCEQDFWAFCKLATSFGKYKIKDKDHPHYGRLWIDEPFLFERCRIFQRDIEEENSRVFYNFPRYYFKTTLLTQNGSLWLLAKDPLHRICILTYKVDQTGEQIYLGAKREMESNAILHTHWPDRFSPNVRDYGLWTNQKLMILNPGPAKEPSLSIHSLDRQPTSGHYSILLFDDPVVKETVKNYPGVKRCIHDLRTATALRQDDTLVFYIGTIWDLDDPWMTLEREGFFSRRDHVSCYDSENEPVLRSAEFLRQWRLDLGEYMFSCLMVGIPVPKGLQRFQQSWIQYYENSPVEERKNKAVDIFCDFSEGKIDGDYHALRVVGFGVDKKRYNLDLHREKIGLTDAFSLLFRLVQQWKPERVWLEPAHWELYSYAIKKEMEHRKIRFSLQNLDIKRAKEARIQLMQPFYERGEIWYPKDGFGHGSSGDDRDTMEQYMRDEYVRWSPVPDSVPHDDGLDTEAWHCQPEFQSRIHWPVDDSIMATVDDEFLTSRLKKVYGRDGLYDQVSPWAIL